MTTSSVTSGKQSLRPFVLCSCLPHMWQRSPQFSASCRFCVVIKKENYPDQQPAKRVTDSAKQIYRQPGHSVYLLPTMVLANLLPCDFNYYIKGTSIKGSLKPGKEAILHAADTSQNMELGQGLANISIWLELMSQTFFWF